MTCQINIHIFILYVFILYLKNTPDRRFANNITFHCSDLVKETNFAGSNILPRIFTVAQV